MFCAARDPEDSIIGAILVHEQFNQASWATCTLTRHRKVILIEYFLRRQSKLVSHIIKHFVHEHVHQHIFIKCNPLSQFTRRAGA